MLINILESLTQFSGFTSQNNKYFDWRFINIFGNINNNFGDGILNERTFNEDDR